MEKYKFGVLGVGPVGGIMAAHLVKAGHDVTLIDVMKAHMNEIKKSGLSVTGFKEIDAQFPEKNICYGIDELAGKEIDYLFISVKASILPQILPIIKQVVKPGIKFIALQNDEILIPEDLKSIIPTIDENINKLCPGKKKRKLKFSTKKTEIGKDIVCYDLVAVPQNESEKIIAKELTPEETLQKQINDEFKEICKEIACLNENEKCN